jgi:propanediol dehydratase small subunit
MDDKKRQYIKWLEDTANSLQLQLDLADGIGERSVCISIERANHYIEVCKTLIHIISETEKDGEG